MLAPIQRCVKNAPRSAFPFSDSETELAMKRRNDAPPRREAMGGLAKGLNVIRAFTRESPALTLSEIAHHAGLSAATARRCLLTLAESGYVMQSGRNFLLRPKVLELGAAYLESMNIETLTKTYLEDLARQTGDSAALTVLDGLEIVYVARTSVRTLMRLEAHVGSRFPAYPTSMGRVLLAGLSPERLQKYFDEAQFTALTERTVTDPLKLRKLIEECRRAGYSAVEDELAYGVVAVAVPVYDASRRVVAALNSSSHSKKITKTKLVRERLTLLQELSAQISRELDRVPGLSLSAQT
jgi:IclR family transcriptional regulator, pca regulon regulatory protein